MSDILQIEKAKVLEAAEKCSTFKEIAKTLWPETFEEGRYVDLTNQRKVHGSTVYHHAIENVWIEFYWDGEALTNKAFNLSPSVHWELRHENGRDVLIPTRK